MSKQGSLRRLANAWLVHKESHLYLIQRSSTYARPAYITCHLQNNAVNVLASQEGVVHSDVYSMQLRLACNGSQISRHAALQIRTGMKQCEGHRTAHAAAFLSSAIVRTSWTILKCRVGIANTPASADTA
jgi:hypothetical protein